MKRSVRKAAFCIAALAALFLLTAGAYAARAGKTRGASAEPAPAAEEAQQAQNAPDAAVPAAEEAASAEKPAEPAEASVPAEGQAQDGQDGQDGGDRPRRGPHGRDGRRMEREPVVPFDEALAAAGKSDPIRLNQPDFITDDQVQLRGLYFKGDADEQTTPVILLHGKDGKKEDWQDLAKSLAEQGAAVLVPDLRGYGESTAAYIEDYSFGGNPPMVRPNRYLASGFGPSDWDAMRYDDGHFWLRFLVYLHNKKMINIRRLVLVGNGYGACVAASWLMEDWKAPSSKKGQFIRGLLMISPEADDVFEKLGSGKTKAGKVAYKIYVGALEKERMDAADSIGLQLAKEKSSTPEEERKVPIEKCQTERQGTALLKASSFNMPEQIFRFVTEEAQSETTPAKWQAIKNFE